MQTSKGIGNKKWNASNQVKWKEQLKCKQTTHWNEIKQNAMQTTKEMQTSNFMIWIWLVVSISDDDNRHAKSVSPTLPCLE